MIDDPLPATFEAVNPNFTSMTANAAGAAGGAVENWFSDYTEMRRDRTQASSVNAWSLLIGMSSR